MATGQKTVELATKEKIVKALEFKLLSLIHICGTAGNFIENLQEFQIDPSLKDDGFYIVLERQKVLIKEYANSEYAVVCKRSFSKSFQNSTHHDLELDVDLRNYNIALSYLERSKDVEAHFDKEILNYKVRMQTVDKILMEMGETDNQSEERSLDDILKDMCDEQV